jgi:hypothetical protein
VLQVASATPWAQISFSVVLILAGKLPSSMRYWLRAFLRVLTLMSLSALRTWAICLCGFIATMTIAASIPMAAMTRRISRRVNPFCVVCFILCVVDLITLFYYISCLFLVSSFFMWISFFCVFCRLGRRLYEGWNFLSAGSPTLRRKVAFWEKIFWMRATGGRPVCRRGGGLYDGKGRCGK